MRRLAIVAGLGILALGAVAIAVIVWVTSGTGGDALQQGSDPDQDAVRARLQERAPSPPAPPLPPEMQLRVPSSANASEEQRAWEQIRPLTKPIAPLVSALAAPVGPCFDEDTKARFGPMPHTALSDASGTPSGPTTLLLQMEAVEGGLRIVDAPVARLGAGGDGFVACVQQVLRGRTVPLPQLQYQPGDRITMSYTPRPTPAAARASSTQAGAAPAPPAVPRQRGKGVVPRGP